MADGRNPSNLEEPAGFSFKQRLQGHTGVVLGMSWSPDGQRLATCSDDKTVCVWNNRTGRIQRRLTGHNRAVTGVSWSADGDLLCSGSLDSTVGLWQPRKGQGSRDLFPNDGPILSACWSPVENGVLASAGQGKRIHLWGLSKDDRPNILWGHASEIICLAWSPDGKTLLSGTKNGTIGRWDDWGVDSQLRQVFDGHKEPVWSISWSPDGQHIASGSADSTIRIWDCATHQTVNLIEVHQDEILCVQYSPCGSYLASQSYDGTIRVWHCGGFEEVAQLPLDTCRESGGLAFHPLHRLLATRGEDDSSVIIWKTDFDTLYEKDIEHVTRYYRNAKVVLVGETGVGKSGLSIVLAGKKFEPTVSTHAREILPFELNEVTLPDGDTETRETLIWDTGGQPEFEFIHQLHIHEAAVVLVVFDNRYELDPFNGVRRWARALNRVFHSHGSKSMIKKFLVAARCDCGQVPIRPQELEELKETLSFEGYFATSALEGWGVETLRDAIRDAINWNALPQVTSTGHFQHVQKFLIDEKAKGRVLARLNDLWRTFEKGHVLDRKGRMRKEFELCVGRLANMGLVRRLSFGNYVLLQPEKLDAYAFGIVQAAVQERKGRGCIREDDAYQGNFPIRKADQLEDKQLQRLLLIATVEELLNNELALKVNTQEGTFLVFPSHLTSRAPRLEKLTGKKAVYLFEGPIRNIYAQLTVRLSNCHFFTQRSLWKNAALYEASVVGGLCGITIREIHGGQAELSLFFDESVNDITRSQFEDYVVAQLESRAVPNSLTCRRSDNRPTHTHEEINEVVADMDRHAISKRDESVAQSSFEGKKQTQDYDVFLCYNKRNLQDVKAIAHMLKEKKILPWLDEWCIKPGSKWSEELTDQIKTVRAAAIFIGSEKLSHWQDRELQEILDEQRRRPFSVIPIILHCCGPDLRLPSWLKSYQYVDFRKWNPNPLDQLVRGIKGNKF